MKGSGSSRVPCAPPPLAPSRFGIRVSSACNWFAKAGVESTLPMFVRELRREARSGSQYWLRVCGGLILLGLFLLLWPSSPQSPAALTRYLFAATHSAMLGSILIFAPALTADCLSSERREGTLGLLFLTPLTPWSIVVGKSLVQIGRAAVLWLATIPIAAVVFLLGPISWLDVAIAVAIQFSALLLALAGGLVASSLTRRATSAILLGEILAIFFTLLLFVCAGAMFYHLNGPGFRNLLSLPQGLRLAGELTSGLLIMDGWSRILPTLPGGKGLPAWLVSLAAAQMFSVGGLWLSSVAAAFFVKRSWRDQSHSPAALRRRRKWLAPRFRIPAFQRSMRKKLGRNPILWLENYYVGERVSKWVLFGLIGLMEMPMVLDDSGDLAGMRTLVVLLILVGICFQAARSYQRERQTGVWELIMVSPLSTRSLVFGRLQAIWSQFLPACAIGFLALPPKPSDGIEPFSVFHLIFLSSILTLPIIGMYLSFRLTSFIVAWGAAFAFGVLGPIMVPNLIDWLVTWSQREASVSIGFLMPMHGEAANGMMWFTITQWSIALICAWLVWRGLERRSFSWRPKC